MDSSSSDEERIVKEKKAGVGKSRAPPGIGKEKLVEWGSDNCKILLEAITKSMDDFRAEHPKKIMLRRHIDWSKVETLMNEKGFNLSSDELRQYLNRIIKSIKTERSLQDIIFDACSNLPKILTPSALTAYFIYKKETLKKLQGKYPELDNLKLNEKLSKRWNKLSEKKKQKYFDESQTMREQIRASHPELYSAQKKKSKPLSFKLKIPIPPTNLTSFFFQRESSKFPGKTYKERRSLIDAQWRKITGQEIQSLSKEFEEAKRNFESYKKNLPVEQKKELESFMNRKLNERTKNAEKPEPSKEQLSEESVASSDS